MMTAKMVSLTGAELEEIAEWMESVVRGRLESADQSECNTYRDLVRVGSRFEPIAARVLGKVMLAQGKLDLLTPWHKERMESAQKKHGPNVVRFQPAS